MMRVRGASVIAALSLLVLAAIASAECAWDARASVVDHPDSIGDVDRP